MTVSSTLNGDGTVDEVFVTDKQEVDLHIDCIGTTAHLIIISHPLTPKAKIEFYGEFTSPAQKGILHYNREAGPHLRINQWMKRIDYLHVEQLDNDVYWFVYNPAGTDEYYNDQYGDLHHTIRPISGRKIMLRDITASISPDYVKNIGARI